MDAAERIRTAVKEHKKTTEEKVKRLKEAVKESQQSRQR